MKIKTALALMFIGGTCTGITASALYFKNKYAKIAEEEIKTMREAYNELLKEELKKEYVDLEDKTNEVEDPFEEPINEFERMVEENKNKVVKRETGTVDYSLYDTTTKDYRDIPAISFRPDMTKDGSFCEGPNCGHDPRVISTEEYLESHPKLKEDVEKGIVKIEDCCWASDYDPDKIYVISPDEYGMAGYKEVDLIYFEPEDIVVDRNGSMVDIEFVLEWEWLSMFEDENYTSDYIHVRNENMKTDYEIVKSEKYYDDVFETTEKLWKPREEEMRWLSDIV